MKNKTIWIVDDDTSFCTYLTKVLENNNNYKVIGYSYDVQSAIDDLKKITPDLITIDLSLPDGTGVDLLKWLSNHMQEPKKIVISFWGQEDLVFEAFTYGADAFLQKDHLLTMEVSKAIDLIDLGGTPISPRLAKRFLNFFLKKDKEIKNKSINKIELQELDLTRREMEVLELLVEGYSYNEISDKLFISVNTVSSHLKKVYKKINVSSKYEAMIESEKHQWFKK